MHLRLLIAVVACLVLDIGTAVAGESAGGFLSRMLADEFNAGNSVRLRHVIVTDGKGATTGDCDCSEPRELFYAWTKFPRMGTKGIWHTANASFPCLSPCA